MNAGVDRLMADMSKGTRADVQKLVRQLTNGAEESIITLFIFSITTTVSTI